jgi:hypothetical protein
MQGKEPEKDEAADVRFLLISGAAPSHAKKSLIADSLNLNIG